MNPAILRHLPLALLLSCSHLALADEGTNTQKQFEHGQKMHAQHCTKCHADEVYTRENRFVKSLDALSKQVLRCKNNTGAPWFDEDTEAVVHFLNEKYYKF